MLHSPSLPNINAEETLHALHIYCIIYHKLLPRRPFIYSSNFHTKCLAYLGNFFCKLSNSILNLVIHLHQELYGMGVTQLLVSYTKMIGTQLTKTLNNVGWLGHIIEAFPPTSLAI